MTQTYTSLFDLAPRADQYGLQIAQLYLEERDADLTEAVGDLLASSQAVLQEELAIAIASVDTFLESSPEMLGKRESTDFLNKLGESLLRAKKVDPNRIRQTLFGGGDSVIPLIPEETAQAITSQIRERLFAGTASQMAEGVALLDRVPKPDAVALLRIKDGRLVEGKEKTVAKINGNNYALCKHLAIDPDKFLVNHGEQRYLGFMKLNTLFADARETTKLDLPPVVTEQVQKGEASVGWVFGRINGNYRTLAQHLAENAKYEIPNAEGGATMEQTI